MNKNKKKLNKYSKKRKIINNGIINNKLKKILNHKNNKKHCTINIKHISQI